VQKIDTLFPHAFNLVALANCAGSIRLRNLPGCSSCVHGSACTRCPGLAYMEGNMRGPSIQDCEKSFARTGVASENLKSHKADSSTLIQIHLAEPCGNRTETALHIKP
jgi:hypothetical protein